MNRIITTSILDPLIQQPFTGRSLDFIQDATKNVILGVTQSLIGESYDSSKAYIIKGLDAYGTNQYNEGFVLWGGEIYYSPGKSSITAFANVPVLTITVANDATADPVTFSDLVSRNVHNVRTLVLSDAVSGSGTFDLSNAIYIHHPWINITGGVGYQNSWVDSPGEPVGRYKIEGKFVILGGVCTGGATLSTVFTLPVGYRPLSKRYYIVPSRIDVTRICQVVIFTSGAVQIIYQAGATDISIEGIRIPLD